MTWGKRQDGKVLDAREFRAPPVIDADVSWACSVLALPRTAFSGPDGSDPRLDVLKHGDSLDVEACPGSGKTTLLVAKLAILARKWTDRRRGICVLSHTNVARLGIEEKLGHTEVGERLLSYPHFVGTIHSFVDEFLALPWLRSLGYPVRVVDTDLCTQHRHRLLQLNRFRALAGYVRPRTGNGRPDPVSMWRVTSSAFDVRRENGKREFKDETGNAARQLAALAEQCVRDGYYRYDEMFTWALDLLERVPVVRQWLRNRFPLVFIDEVQDNSEEQSAILLNLFAEGDGAVVRQRFGDSNQAIYQHIGQEGATTDVFPDPALRRDIPNSHRFGQEIADLAKPLGLVPQNLVGCGPSQGISSDATGRHAVFVFQDAGIHCVLPAYARYLCEIFTADDLERGSFVAVGGVHRPSEGQTVPRSVGHYWPDYDHELRRTDPSPKTFRQFLMAGRGRAEESGEAWHVVENIAAGILKLARLANPTVDLGNRRRRHQQVLELLADRPEERARYEKLVVSLGVEGAMPTAEDWASKWRAEVGQIAGALGEGQFDWEKLAAFLEWCPVESGTAGAPASAQRDNFFCYPERDPTVRIRVGSIHSVKGETHTATLVLDTFYHRLHLATLKPWLLGAKTGGGAEGKRNQSRLKQHYVAMTRPSHLVCLAMREDSLAEGDVANLKARGWRVARVGEHSEEWL